MGANLIEFMKPCRRRNSPLSQRSSLAPSTSDRCLGPDRPVETVGAPHDGTVVGICVGLDRLNIIALLAKVMRIEGSRLRLSSLSPLEELLLSLIFRELSD